MQEQLKNALGTIPGWKIEKAKISPLGGGITNTNFKVELPDGTYAVRVYGANTDCLGIDRNHEITCNREAAALGLAPEVVYHFKDEGMLVTKFVSGITLNEEQAAESSRMKKIIHGIRTLHKSATFPGTFSPFQVVRNYYAQAKAVNVVFPDTIDALFSVMVKMEGSLYQHHVQVACHNDLLCANFIDDGKRIWILDWEYGASGDGFFDLGNFAVNQGLDGAQCEELLGYYTNGTVTDLDRARLNLMRLASDLRESFWGFLQSGVSRINFDYKEYALKHYNRFWAEARKPEFNNWIAAL